MVPGRRVITPVAIQVWRGKHAMSDRTQIKDICDARGMAAPLGELATHRDLQ
jgi:hypothetical protein